MKYTFILVLYLYIRGLQQASEETYFKEAILCPFTKSCFSFWIQKEYIFL